jgi:hypothetical protein
VCHELSISRCTLFGQVLIECFAQVLSPAIGAQDLDRLAILLSDCPGLVGFVGLKSLVLCAQHKGGCVLGYIVCEGDEVSSTLVQGDRGWSPHIGMYLISEVLYRWANPDLWDGQACGTCKYAGIAVRLLGAQIQFDSYDSAAFNKFACAQGCNMAHTAVQFHDRHWLNSVG